MKEQSRSFTLLFLHSIRPNRGRDRLCFVEKDQPCDLKLAEDCDL